MHVDANRLEELRNKFPAWALELDLVSGRVSSETGLINPNHEPDNMQDAIELQVLEVLDLIYGQGHSGFSHGYFCNLLIPLLKSKPITPLTGRDWEWEINSFSDGPMQNKRCSQVFKEGDRAYNIYGRAFSDDGGDTWYTSRESRVDISFPCTTKDLETEYVIIEGEEYDESKNS